MLFTHFSQHHNSNRIKLGSSLTFTFSKWPLSSGTHLRYMDPSVMLSIVLRRFFSLEAYSLDSPFYWVRIRQTVATSHVSNNLIMTGKRSSPDSLCTPSGPVNPTRLVHSFKSVLTPRRHLSKRLNIPSCLVGKKQTNIKSMRDGFEQTVVRTMDMYLV